MGQRPAKGLHIALAVLGAGLYILFVIPRWWVLIGDIPATLGTVGRIATGFPIAAAAIPVMVTLRQSLKPDLKTPELALRLRAWSAVLHVVAGGLLIVTALAEIWLPLEKAGPWLFAVYGAAGSIAVLAIAAFYLSFVAERPPAPPKPPKPEKVKKTRKAEKAEKAEAVDEHADDGGTEQKTSRLGRLGRKRGAAAGSDDEEKPATEDTDAVSADTDDPQPEQVEATSPEETADNESATDDTEGEPGGGLKNIRPTGKRRHRLRR